jgi:hypothetical protein
MSNKPYYLTTMKNSKLLSKETWIILQNKISMKIKLTILQKFNIMRGESKVLKVILTTGLSILSCNKKSLIYKWKRTVIYPRRKERRILWIMQASNFQTTKRAFRNRSIYQALRASTLSFTRKAIPKDKTLYCTPKDSLKSTLTSRKVKF